MEMIKIKNMNNSFMLISRLDMQKIHQWTWEWVNKNQKTKRKLRNKEKKFVQELWCNIKWFTILVIGVPGEERMWVKSINNILRKLPKGGNHRSLFLNAIERRNKVKINSLIFVHSSTRRIDMDSLLSHKIYLNLKRLKYKLCCKYPLGQRSNHNAC